MSEYDNDFAWEEARYPGRSNYLTHYKRSGPLPSPPHPTTPHPTSPHLHHTSPHLTSSHITPPHLISPYLTTPNPTSHHLTSTSPHLIPPYPTPSHPRWFAEFPCNFDLRLFPFDEQSCPMEFKMRNAVKSQVQQSLITSQNMPT